MDRDAADNPSDRQTRVTDAAANTLAAADCAHLLAPARTGHRRAALERLDAEASHSLAALRSGGVQRLAALAAADTHTARAHHVDARAAQALATIRRDELAPLFKLELLREHIAHAALALSRREANEPTIEPPIHRRTDPPAPPPLLTAQGRAQLLIDAGLGQEVPTRQERDIPSERRQRAREKAIGNHAH
ncbi:MAG TPA: hypothetical protein VNL71_13580 [Chloroflexota bacterium]|nr:hypothetical protein [Chloroflexota bacterium]